MDDSILNKYGIKHGCIQYEYDLGFNLKDYEFWTYGYYLERYGIYYKTRHYKSLVNFDYYIDRRYTVSLCKPNRIKFNVYDTGMMTTAIDIFRGYYNNDEPYSYNINIRIPKSVLSKITPRYRFHCDIIAICNTLTSHKSNIHRVTLNFNNIKKFYTIPILLIATVNNKEGIFIFLPREILHYIIGLI